MLYFQIVVLDQGSEKRSGKDLAANYGAGAVQRSIGDAGALPITLSTSGNTRRETCKRLGHECEVAAQ
jgi:hypothetical protein